MASRTLRDTGTPHDGRVVDIGASYFTVAEDEFGSVISDLVDRDVVRPWTTSFHVAGPAGLEGVTVGPMRYAAPRGLRSVVEALADGLDVSADDTVGTVTVGPDAVAVDDQPVSAAALCLPDPQARRVYADLPVSPITWEPVIAITCVFATRTWQELDGVFVNDDPVLTWIADDGRRRGDDAPVLVAHVNPVLAALSLHNPSVAVAPALAALQRVLGISDYPEWVESHRWTFAKPLAASADPYWLAEGAALGAAGDAWSDGPKVEAAWLSGRRLGMALAERVASGGAGER
jgi:renalase